MEQSLVIKVTIADGPGLSTSPVASAPSAWCQVSRVGTLHLQKQSQHNRHMQI